MNNNNNNGDINADNDVNETNGNSNGFSNHSNNSSSDFVNSIDNYKPPLIESPSQEDVTKNSTFEKNIRKSKTSQDWHQYNIDIRMFEYLSKNDKLFIGLVFFCSLAVHFQIYYIEVSNYTIEMELLNYLIFFNIIFPFLFQRKYDLLIFVSILFIYLFMYFIYSFFNLIY